MTTPRQHRRPRLLVPSVLCAFVLALVLAAGASAETRVGETTSPADPAAPAEADLVAASASYESTTGTVTLSVTTAAAPGTNPEFTLFGELVTSPGLCTFAEFGYSPFPAVVMRSTFAQTEADVFWGKEAERTESGEHKGGIEGGGHAPKTVSGTTTTITTSGPQLQNRPYDCVLVGLTRQKSGEEVKALKTVLFPIAVKPPAPVTITTTTTAPAPTPTPAPVLKPALAFPKAPALTPRRERWMTVRFKVSNPGTGPIGPVTIKAKVPKGIRLEPGTLKFPALLPGQTWPASFRMEVTEAAAAKSKIALTATATGLTATGSVLVAPTD